jgi:hypothetical protein
MADTKITALTEATTLADTDIIPVVTAPGSSPLNQKITKGNFVLNQTNLSIVDGGKIYLNGDGGDTYFIKESGKVRLYVGGELVGEWG